MISLHGYVGKRMVMCVATGLLISAAGCKNSADRDGDGEVSKDERSRIIPAEIQLPFKPGQWQNTVMFTQIDVPGLNEKKKQNLMAKMSKTVSKKICLNAADAKKPTADFFGGGIKDACKYRNFSLNNNEVAADLSCQMDGMAVADTKLAGAVSAARFDFDIITDLRLPIIGKVNLRGTSIGRYLGECPK
jgi:Protein of unknown function (DUF3617)